MMKTIRVSAIKQEVRQYHTTIEVEVPEGLSKSQTQQYLQNVAHFAADEGERGDYENWLEDEETVDGEACGSSVVGLLDNPVPGDVAEFRITCSSYDADDGPCRFMKMTHYRR